MSADYDSPWEEALEKYFPALVELCFPAIAAQIDWSAGIEFLETELHEVLRGAAVGRQHVDKLARVRMISGEKGKVMFHVEAQHWPEAEFPARIYSYHVRLCEKGEPVVTVAILADINPSWRPNRYERELLGCRVVFDFPICKLLDLVADREKLEQNHSPAAVLVLANWAAQQTGQDAPERFRWKLRLMRGLYAKGFGRQDILELYRLIDWLLELPKELESQFRTEILRTEEESMPYVTSIERLAKEDGLEAGREEGREEGMKEMLKDTLLVRFGKVPPAAQEKIDRENGLQNLRTMHRRALQCHSFAEFLADRP